ncbi:VWA domain-containing protein [Pararhodospirillum photometricum]|nr:VWA domain-containing protein [Pararhodospirillum photometricum]
MMLSRGTRTPLQTLVGGSAFSLTWHLRGLGAEASVFGLDAQGRLADDRYMVFYNQPTSPCAGVRLAAPDRFEVDVTRLPASLQRLVLVLSVEGPGVFHDVTAGSLVLSAPGHEARFDFTGQEFAQERALMLAEVYRKNDQWRVAIVAQGFNGGLDAVVRHFGGEVAEDTPPPPRVSLEKRVAAEAPHLVDLTKKVGVSLEKKGLGRLQARVGLVLDASASMRRQYKDGKVQALLDRLLPLALRFDSDGALDVWAFDDRQTPLPPVSLANCRDYIAQANGGWRAWVGGANDEPSVMRDVITHFKKDRSRLPVYILFVSDGGVHKNREIKDLITEASSLPLFWQFMGLGGRNYGVLERLDTMGGRTVDNCGFFAIDDLHDLDDEAFYDRLLQEFPLWLGAARQARIVQDEA